MEKMMTVELDQKRELIELHLNKSGAEYLKNLLIKLIDANNDDHLHLMSPECGGNELSLEEQNLNLDINLMHHLKIIYWKE